MSLYFILLIVSIAIPLALSFDKKLRFYSQWKYLFPAILIITAFYVAFDVYFTKEGVWGFNPKYYGKLFILGLPLEEMLFFLVIPYCSIFLHDARVLYFPKYKLESKTSIYFTVILITGFLILSIVYHEKAYTIYVSILTLIALLLSLLDKSRVMEYFYVSYLFILIPFLIVNGILTGSLIEQEVVWYNNSENLGLRFCTIPVEDFAYGFSLIYFNLLLRERIKTMSQNISKS
jgi:lycopene cyclase domain-containing protein